MRLTALFLSTLILPFASEVSSAGPSYDCEKGCYVATCEGESCSLWRCDTGTCRKAATRDQLDALPEVTPSTPESELAYVKICPSQNNCSLVELSHGQAVDLGSFENVDHVIASRKLLRADERD